ncbi:helix-turn-helix domain-containing protein [Nocardia veterana]|uniref:Helix-turn-helix domain-containing protein n=1 Tax=Nocardia veterana TaxID=132249 RepID=A0A7X6RIV2_9NOCA|nr:helix-turn-helix domain-containing protein [Nocardia veterana]NKY87577.1 helix-turn-helix domain-containing protein [Nocardia veterana]
MPSLPPWLEQLRTERGWSRETAGARATISGAYVTKIEHGRSVPTIDTLAKIVRGYDLNPAQRRHTYDLWNPPQRLPADDELQHQVSTPQLTAHLAHLDAAHILCAYTTPLSTVLAASARLHDALPGLREAGNNLALWFFQPPARGLVVDWDDEAPHVVAALRAAIGPYRESHHARALLRTLATNPQFAELWTTHPTAVDYGRPSGKPVLLQRSGSSDPVAISLQISEFHSPHAVLVAYGISNASAECA